MEGIWNNIKQKLQELKKDKNAALRKCLGILLAGICLLVILWPSDKENGFSGLDALTGTKQDKTSGGVTPENNRMESLLRTMDREVRMRPYRQTAVMKII